MLNMCTDFSWPFFLTIHCDCCLRSLYAALGMNLEVTDRMREPVRRVHAFYIRDLSIADWASSGSWNPSSPQVLRDNCTRQGALQHRASRVT